MAEITHNNENVTDYQKNVRDLYFIDNVKWGLQNMKELNDALGKPLDDLSIQYFFLKYKLSLNSEEWA